MRPHGRRAHVNAGAPEAFAQCDRCGFWYNRSGLQWQYEWSGTILNNTGKLVCQAVCMDVPQEQLRTILLPPDPPSVLNSRPPNFVYEEAGPVQGVLAATALKGSNTLVLQPANGSLNDARSFAVGDVVWVQLVDAAYSANISFGQYQIFNIDISANTLFVHDLLTAAGIIATAPINGTVTFATHPIIPPPVVVLSIEATFSGTGSLDAQQLRPMSVLLSVLSPDGVPKEPYKIAGEISPSEARITQAGITRVTLGGNVRVVLEPPSPTVWFATVGFSGTGG